MENHQVTERNAAIKLDWTRLLGFDQVGDPTAARNGSAIKDPRFAKVGVKIGAKSGLKPITSSESPS